MHAKNWCTVYCVLVSNLWFYFPLWCHWKRKWLDLLMEIRAVTALAERWKVKLSFQAKAFQLTMRTDFPFLYTICTALWPEMPFTVQREWRFPERIRIRAVFQPGILTFTSRLWAQVGRKLPDAYQPTSTCHFFQKCLGQYSISDSVGNH